MFLKNSVLIFILLLATVLFTRAFIPYLRLDTIQIISNDRRMKLVPANDLNTCVYQRAKRMTFGKPMNDPNLYLNSACGQFFSIIISPFIISDYLNIIILYRYYIAFVAINYLIFLAFLLKGSPERYKNIALLFILGFLFSVPGILGIYMGNVDVLLSSIFALILYFLVKEKKRYQLKLFKGVILGLVLGSIVNAKIFLLPFALIAVFFSGSILISFAAFLISFTFFTYFPNFFGSQSGFAIYLNSVFDWSNKATLAIGPFFNHSIAATLTIFNSCPFDYSCSDDNFLILAKILTTLFFIILLVPFRLIYKKRRELKQIDIQVKSLVRSSRVFYRLCRRVMLDYSNNAFALRAALVIFLFSLIHVYINIAPRIAFDYRLYFSVPILLVIMVKTIKLEKALIYCLVSMMSLILGGLWVVSFTGSDIKIVDSRIMNIFIYIHFFFLVKSSMLLLKFNYSKYKNEKFIKRIK
jgi:hypothetical protein